MDLAVIMEAPVFTWVVLPLLIFCMRIIDVTIGTIRIIYVARGVAYLATLCGFFEVLIWLVSITQIMQNLDNYVTYLAYAGGFATGNFVGIAIENRLAVGLVGVRAITQADATALVQRLADADFGVTTIAAQGTSGEVRLVFTVIKRKHLQTVVDIIKQHNPNAFISVEDVRAVREGYFPGHTRLQPAQPGGMHDGARKAK
jgi:uncharacterized protein YebE (UPF0316 family)